jgi:hypothetical protein
MTENITPQRYPNGPQRYPAPAIREVAMRELEPIEAELVEAGVPDFLPLVGRRAAYVAALLLVVAAPIVAVSSPDYAAAILAAAAPLEAAALGVALANPTR